MFAILSATHCGGFGRYCERTKETKRTKTKGDFKMKYNGQELEPITEPQLFDPPKVLLADKNAKMAKKLKQRSRYDKRKN
jgi:hypothetical protein